jgi:CheY-like chemotaxis protein
VPDVLIVDDDPRVRALLQLSLLTNGYTVREARDGFEALLEVAQQRPDAMVMDLSMPRIGGFEMLDAMYERGLTQDMRIVVHTSEDDPVDVERAAALGIAEYFLKPVDPEVVVEAIGEHLVTEDLDPLRDPLATVTPLKRHQPPLAVTDPTAAAL